MIFMCDKKCQTAIFTIASDNSRPISSKSKQTEVDLSTPTRAKREQYYYVESFDKAAIRHNTMLHCQETVADSKYS